MADEASNRAGQHSDKISVSDLLKLVKSSDGKIYRQGRANAPKGAYCDDVIYLFEKANASTFMRETAVYRPRHFGKRRL